MASSVIKQLYESHKNAYRQRKKMRELKIEREINKLSIEKYQNKAIAEIARRYSKSEKQIDMLYEFGILKYDELKSELSKDHFIRFSIWNVTQEIIKKQKEMFDT